MIKSIVTIIISVINVYFLIKTASFVVYEYNQKNVIGSIICAITELIAFLLLMYILWIR